MGFWKKFKRVLGIGWKVGRWFYTPPEYVDVIANAVLMTEKGKLQGHLKNLSKIELAKTALDYAVENTDLVNWVEKKIGSNDPAKIEGYLHPTIEEFYKQNKRKIKKKAKKLLKNND